MQRSAREMRRPQMVDQGSHPEMMTAASLELFQLKQRLQKEIHDRQETEKELQALKLEMEKRVRSRTRRLEAANRELESFGFAVSHDLRSPLTSIIGFSNALLEDCGDGLPDQAQQYVERIIAASSRMRGKIDALLNFSRMNLTQLSVTDLDLSEMAREIIQDLREASPRENVAVEIAAGLTVKADRVLLRVALENMLGNAWKYTAKKDAAVITVGETLVDGKKAYFVSDNGAGFDMTHADKLFEPFQRLHRIDEFEGNGIGLTTVQRIIRHHGGDVWANAEVDKGATFYFTIGQVESYETAAPLQ